MIKRLINIFSPNQNRELEIPLYEAFSMFTKQLEELGIIFGISAIVLSAGFIGATWLLKRRDSIELAMPIYLYSMAYLALLFVVMVVESFISV